MSDHAAVQKFLENLELSQYITAFLDCGYDDAEKCSRLTDTDLDKIGVSLVGHRKRILMASGSPQHFAKVTEVGDEDLYDILPTPKPISQPMSFETEYINSSVLDTTPPPALPPKTKNYDVDDFEKFGIVKYAKVVDKSFASNKTPVPMPRRFVQASEKPKLPPLRVPKPIDDVNNKIGLPDLSPSSAPILALNSVRDRFDQFPSVSALTSIWNSSSHALGNSVKKSVAKPSISEKPILQIKPVISPKSVSAKPTDNSLNLISFDVYGKSASLVQEPETNDNGRPLYDALDETSIPPHSPKSQSESESIDGLSIYDEIMFENEKDIASNNSWPTKFCTTASTAPFSNDLVASTGDVASTNIEVPESLYSMEKPDNFDAFEPIYQDEDLSRTSVNNRQELQSLTGHSSNTNLNLHDFPLRQATEFPSAPEEERPMLPLKTHVPLTPTFDSWVLNNPPPVPNRINAPPPIPIRSNGTPFSPVPFSNSPLSSPAVRQGGFEKLEECDEDYVFPDGEEGFRSDFHIDKKAGIRTSLTSAIVRRFKPNNDLSASFDEGRYETAHDGGYFSKRSTQMDLISQNEQDTDEACMIHPVDAYSSQNSTSPKFCLPIYLAGNLTLVAKNNSPDSGKKWCILERNTFRCVESDKTTIFMEPMDMNELLGIAITKVDKRENTFQLAHRLPSKNLVFSAESEKCMRLWMTKLARSMAAVKEGHIEQITDLDRGGNLFVKYDSSTEWMRTWIHLCSKNLSIYTQEEEFEEIDLRKSKSIKFLSVAGSPAEGVDSGLPFVIQLSNNRTIHIQCDTKKETENWFCAIRSFMLVTDGSLADQVLTGDNVPVLVDKCINFVATYGMKTVGIYRIAGQNSKITRLLDLLKADPRGVILKLEDYQVQEVTTALKRFFRHLNEPLLTDSLYSQWLETAKIDSTASKLQRYKFLLDQLPRVNYCTLKRISIHLRRISENESTNRMSILNLASLFGPILLKIDKVEMDLGLPHSPENDPSKGQSYDLTNQEISVMKDIITNSCELFDIKDEELEQERRIDEAVEKIERLNTTRRPSDLSNTNEELLLGIYIGSKDDDVINVKVSVAMSALDIETYIDAKLSFNETQPWTLFEVICDGQLERPIHYSESIIEVLLSWSSWPIEICRNNYIIYKRNNLYDTLSLVHDTDATLCSQLKFSRKKNFSKHLFEFNQGKISFHKDSKPSSTVNVWDVSDLIIYLGVQRERSPPTPWGITFYFAGGEPLSTATNFFGFSLCCKNEEEMCRWLAMMLHAQHPEGLLPQEGACVGPRLRRSLLIHTLSTEDSAPMSPHSTKEPLSVTSPNAQKNARTLSKIGSFLKKMKKK